MISNPFLLYPPSPGSTAHPERPWWFRQVLQQDLVQSIGRVQGERYHWSRWPDGRLIKDRRWVETPTVGGYYLGEPFDVTKLTGETDEMDRLDDLEPVECPMLAPGQIWAIYMNNGIQVLNPLGGMFLMGNYMNPDYPKIREFLSRGEALLLWGPNDLRWVPIGWKRWALNQ